MKNVLSINNQRGATAVEMGIVFILLSILIFGIIEFSLLLYNKAMITNASREGARLGVVWAPEYEGNLYGFDKPSIEVHVKNWLGNNLISFGDATENIIVTSDDACLDPQTEDVLTVRVEFPYKFLILPNFVTNLAGTIILSSETNMRCESIYDSD